MFWTVSKCWTNIFEVKLCDCKNIYHKRHHCLHRNRSSIWARFCYC
uniref:Uncharacterized protein n=1 Tax=Rhizophora mucronata TaxID=61149 RepID=A0A2P2MZ68_RHIMU